MTIFSHTSPFIILFIIIAQTQSQSFEEFEQEILKHLELPILDFNQEFYYQTQKSPNPILTNNYHESSQLNNSPATNYTIIETSQGVAKSRMTRDIYQFGPAEVDRYVFTFSINPEYLKQGDLIDDAVVRIFKLGSVKKVNQHSFFRNAYLSLVDDDDQVISSELVSVDKEGWVRLDCTDFIREQIFRINRAKYFKNDDFDTSISLSIIVESLSNHDNAIKAAQKVRLAKQDFSDKSYRPSLAIHLISGQRFLLRQEKYRNCPNVDWLEDVRELENQDRACCRGIMELRLKDEDENDHQVAKINENSQKLNNNIYDFSITKRPTEKNTVQKTKFAHFSNFMILPDKIKLAKCGGVCKNQEKKCVPIEKQSLAVYYLSMRDDGQIFQRVDVIPDILVSKCACRFVL